MPSVAPYFCLLLKHKNSSVKEETIILILESFIPQFLIFVVLTIMHIIWQNMKKTFTMLKFYDSFKTFSIGFFVAFEDLNNNSWKIYLAI